MAQRCIDTTVHDLTSHQVLEQVLRYFRQDHSEPVVIFTARGRGLDGIRVLRSSLSKLRKTKRDRHENVSHFGFEAFGPIQVKLDDMNKEGYSLRFRVTPLQLMRNLAYKSEVEL